MSRTPTPFEETTLPGSGQYAIKCPRGLVASMEAGSDAVRKTDRTFIVKACNLHDELVAALKASRKELGKRLLTETICTYLDEVLAKAEAK